MLIKLPLLKIKDWRKEIRNRKRPIEKRRENERKRKCSRKIQKS